MNTSTMSESMKHAIKAAIEIYGRQKVEEIIELVEMSDPDGVYSIMMDFEDEDGAAIVEMIYFEIGEDE